VASPAAILARPALTRGAAAVLLLGAAALIGASVRVLPWFLDPHIPKDIVAPFARSVGAVALEAAILVGWPTGWALAAHRLTERGEARVFEMLGERPLRTTTRLLPWALPFVLALFGLSYQAGNDAREPGRVLTELIREAREACARAPAPSSFAVPFVDSAWLCVPGQAPVVVVRGPGGVLLSAKDVQFTQDLRALTATDSRLLLGSTAIHVQSLSLRGLPPWGSSALLSGAQRAWLLVLTGLLAAATACWAALRLGRSAGASRLLAIVLGAAGPLCALGALRLVERRLPEGASPSALWLFALVPLSALLAPLVLLPVLGFLSKLVARRPRMG
jgi:hypothetical protein